jgi:hypothetical protein
MNVWKVSLFSVRFIGVFMLMLVDRLDGQWSGILAPCSPSVQ